VQDHLDEEHCHIRYIHVHIRTHTHIYVHIRTYTCIYAYIRILTSQHPYMQGVEVLEVQDHLDEEHYLEVRGPFLTTGPSLDTLEALFPLSTAEAPFGGH